LRHWWKNYGLFVEYLIVILVMLMIIFGIRFVWTGGVMECAFARVPSLCAEEKGIQDG
jgi:hypothetical protein